MVKIKTLPTLLVYTLLFFSTFIGSTFSDDSAQKHAPRVRSVDLGYTFSIKNTLASSFKAGTGFEFNYGWKLSRYDISRATDLTIPVGVIPFIDLKDHNYNGLMFDYGWAISHELFRDKTVSPFLGYGLLLNQLYVHNIVGRTIGHETRFDVGASYKSNTAVKPFIKVVYSMVTYPALGKSVSDKASIVSVKAGVGW